MAHKVEVFDDWRLAVVLLYEAIDHEQLVAVSYLQSDNPAFSEDCSQLVCVMPQADFNVTVEELRDYAAESPIFGTTSLRAIFVADNPLAFGFARMFELTKNNSAGDIKVFSNFRDACRHIGRRPDALAERLPELQVLLGDAGEPASGAG